MKIRVVIIWVVTSCHVTGNCFLHLPGENGGTKFLLNVGIITQLRHNANYHDWNTKLEGVLTFRSAVMYVNLKS